MIHVLRALAFAAAGAVAMYYLDPAAGRGRRSRLRDRAGAATRRARRDARNRTTRPAPPARGGVDAARGTGPGPAPADGDRQLRERVRARLGRLVADPAAVEVVVLDGRVGLRGSVLAVELDTVLAAVRSMPGVVHVDHRLAASDLPHATLADLPGARSDTGGAAGAGGSAVPPRDAG